MCAFRRADRAYIRLALPVFPVQLSLLGLGEETWVAIEKYGNRAFRCPSSIRTLSINERMDSYVFIRPMQPDNCLEFAGEQGIEFHTNLGHSPLQLHHRLSYQRKELGFQRVKASHARRPTFANHGTVEINMENLVIFIGTPVYSMQGIYASESALFLVRKKTSVRAHRSKIAGHKIRLQTLSRDNPASQKCYR